MILHGHSPSRGSERLATWVHEQPVRDQPLRLPQHGSTDVAAPTAVAWKMFHAQVFTWNGGEVIYTHHESAVSVFNKAPVYSNLSGASKVSNRNWRPQKGPELKLAAPGAPDQMSRIKTATARKCPQLELAAPGTRGPRSGIKTGGRRWSLPNVPKKNCNVAQG